MLEDIFVGPLFNWLWGLINWHNLQCRCFCTSHLDYYLILALNLMGNDGGARNTLRKMKVNNTLSYLEKKKKSRHCKCKMKNI